MWPVYWTVFIQMTECALNEQKLKVKILIDENLSHKLIEKFDNSLFDLKAMTKEPDRGITDDKVLEKAILEQRALLTHNGKDFIVLVPTKGETDHYGLFWLKFQPRPSQYSLIADKIKELVLLNTSDCVENFCEHNGYCKGLYNKSHSITRSSDCTNLNFCYL